MRSRAQPGLFRLHAHILVLTLLLICGANLIVYIKISAHYAGMTWVGVLPVLLAIRAFSPRQAMYAGALWGAAVFASSSAVGGPAPGPSAGAVVSALVTVAAPAGFAYAGGRLSARIGFNPLALALGWVLLELAVSTLHLSNGFLGFVHGESNLTHWVSVLLGDSFLGFLVVFAGALFVYLAGAVEFRLVPVGILTGVRSHGLLRPPTRNPVRLPQLLLRSSEPRPPPDAVARIDFSIQS